MRLVATRAAPTPFDSVPAYNRLTTECYVLWVESAQSTSGLGWKADLLRKRAAAAVLESTQVVDRSSTRRRGRSC